MTEQSIVQTYIDLALALPDATADELSQQLQSGGMEVGAAERAIAFVPIAFGRVALRGAKFPEEFEIRDLDSGRALRGRFAEEPIFVAALTAAEAIGPTDARAVQIASWSAEMAVAKELLRPGDRPSSIGFVEPILLRIPIGPESGKKPWWRLW